MAYRIVYQEDTVVWIPEKLRWGRIAALSMVCFAGFCILAAKLWPDGAALIREAFHSEKVSAVRTGLQQMALHLRTGESLSDAVYVFCREILESAQYPG